MAQQDNKTLHEKALRESELWSKSLFYGGLSREIDIERQKTLEDYKAYLDRRQPTSLRDSSEIIFDHRIDELERKVKELKGMVDQLAEKIGYPETEELVIRKISYSNAKKEISQYFIDHHGENIDPADIQEALGIDIMLAIKICNELESEGKIKGT